MKRPLLISLIVLNTLMMLSFTFYLMKLPWLAGDEKFLIWATSTAQFGMRELPPSEDYALINTSYDLELIDRYDEFGFPVGNQVVTDRQKLSQLLQVINASEKKPKYVLVDIHFVDTTAWDNDLKFELEQIENVILSAHIGEKGQLEPPIFSKVNYGLSDYLIGSAFDGVYKYQLIYEDSLKLTPLKMYEDLAKSEAKQVGPFVKIGGNYTMNNFVMNYRLLQKDILNQEAGFNPVSLGELLYLSNEDIEEFLSNKIVVVGDFFENDMHETIFEITAGPLILLNALITIQEHDTIVNFWFLLIMLIAYGYLSYMVFYDGDYIEKKIAKYTSKKVSRNFIGFTSYFLMLSALSILTFFLFGIHINVFFIAVAFYLMDRLIHLLPIKLKL
ncbi:MAG: CHASE2 domain-containing protein [Ekhidna sp.]|nr:CHASE2 domain-containing protein [Ekhidna sp.]